MASGDGFPQKCAICQEEYDLPHDQLQVIRAKECPLHFVHEECSLAWFREKQRCPVCPKRCSEIVDINGETVERLSSDSAVPDPVVPYIHSYYASTEMQNIDVDRQNLEALGLLLPNQLHPREIELARSFLAQHLAKFSTGRRCQLCKRACRKSDQCITVPCAHKFHSWCLMLHLPNDVSTAICPLEHCRAEIALAGNTTGNHPFNLCHVNPMHLDALLLQAEAPPPPTTRFCHLCKEEAEQEERVLTPLCNHVFHSRCFDSSAGSGLDAVRLCPLCSRECLEVTRIPPRLALANESQPEAVTSMPRPDATRQRPIVCCECKKNVPLAECVKPNTCQHFFHRSCLYRKTKNDKRCPQRGCKKKFRRME